MKPKNRYSDFLILLEARYLPLLLLALPQSYTVAIWLIEANKGKLWAEYFAVIGAMAFEFSYVGAIAWAENKMQSRWVWLTAMSALLFSVLVSIRVYWQEEQITSFLHAGFPIVAFAYTMCMHAPQLAKETNNETTHQSLNESPADSGGMKEDFQPINLHELLEETAPVLVGANVVTNQQQTNNEYATNRKKTQELPDSTQENATITNYAKVKALRDEGATWQEVSNALGKSVRTVQNWYATGGV